jgi:hypothetical protein
MGTSLFLRPSKHELRIDPAWIILPRLTRIAAGVNGFFNWGRVRTGFLIFRNFFGSFPYLTFLPWRAAANLKVWAACKE